MSAPLLPEGARIGIVAPSGRFDPARRDIGLAWLQNLGFETVRFDEDLLPDLYFSASDEVRGERLIAALTDATLDAIWAVRGGYGVTRLLASVPFETILSTPVFGFSDLTPLLETLQRRTGARCVHSPVLHSIGGTDEPSLTHLRALLRGEPTAPLVGHTWRAGEVEAPLRGGNLAMMAATAGTPFQLDATGAILVIEEVNELPYRIDRMLTQLGAAGILEGIAGVALGEFEGCGDAELLDTVLRRATQPLGVPVIAGLPIGHGAHNRAWEVGGVGRMTGDRLFV